MNEVYFCDYFEANNFDIAQGNEVKSLLIKEAAKQTSKHCADILNIFKVLDNLFKKNKFFNFYILFREKGIYEITNLEDYNNREIFFDSDLKSIFEIEWKLNSQNKELRIFDLSYMIKKNNICL